MEITLRLCVYKAFTSGGGLSTTMVLQRATVGGWFLVSAFLLYHSTPIHAQDESSSMPNPESIREEPLPAEAVSPSPLPEPVPAPPPIPLSLLDTLTQTRQALHLEPDAQESDSTAAAGPCSASAGVDDFP